MGIKWVLSGRGAWLAGLGAAAVLLALAGWWHGRDAWGPEAGITQFRSLIYWESGLMPLLLAAVVAGARRRWISTGFAGVLSVLMLLGIYARFIEPNLLTVRHTVLATGYSLKVALISDMHYGLYSTPGQMARLVDRLNALDVQAVLVAGDWTYEPPRNQDLGALLAPFRQLRHPVYSVPGNHDEGQPGPPLQDALRAALVRNRIHPLEQGHVSLGPVELVGLRDVWAGGDGKEQLPALMAAGRPLLLLTHNPDLMDELPPLPGKVVMLAGHTHGGQVNLPWLTDRMLAGVTRGGYKRGLYGRPNGQVFVTSGIGMIGLPLRFAMPPVIDVLEMR